MQRLPASANSFWILDMAVVVFKVLGVLTLLGTGFTVWDTVNDDSLGSDWRSELAMIELLSGIVASTVLASVGAILDLWMSRYERT